MDDPPRVVLPAPIDAAGRAAHGACRAHHLRQARLGSQRSRPYRLHGRRRGLRHRSARRSSRSRPILPHGDVRRWSRCRGLCRQAPESGGEARALFDHGQWPGPRAGCVQAGDRRRDPECVGHRCFGHHGHRDAGSEQGGARGIGRVPTRCRLGRYGGRAHGDAVPDRHPVAASGHRGRDAHHPPTQQPSVLASQRARARRRHPELACGHHRRRRPFSADAG